MPENTLTITDNRTGKSYTVPVEHGTIQAMDLRQIKVSEDDFGLMSYDPHLRTPRPAKAALPTSMAEKAYCAIAVIRLTCWLKKAPISKSLI